jgi:hypothetical protein
MSSSLTSDFVRVRLRDGDDDDVAEFKRVRHLDPDQTRSSEAFSQGASSMMSKDFVVRARGAIDMRKAYVLTFQLQQDDHRHEKEWWKDTFRHASIKTKMAYEEKHPQVKLEEKKTLGEFIYIAVDKKLHKLNRVDFHTVFIGRMEECDVHIGESHATGDKQVVRNDQNVSRLAGVLYYSADRILVVDVGGINGIITIHRGSKQKEMHSMPRDRRVLSFGINEEVVLGMGVTAQVTLNPKVCAACHEHVQSLAHRKKGLCDHCCP